MNKNPLNTVAVNSTVLYITAFIITTMLHESFHALFGFLFDSHPVLHHNYVEHMNDENITSNQHVIIALAGPLISLLQGFVGAVVFFKMKKHNLLQLLIAWISILGFNNFIGYVMTGPLFKAGDIGKVYLLLEIPLDLQIIFALIAAGALVKITLMMSRPYLGFATRREWLADGSSRKKFLFHTIILPWVFGSLIMTGLYLPVIAIISIIYPVMSGFVFIGPWQNGEKARDVTLSGNMKNEKISIKFILVLLVLICVFKFVLQPGIAL